ncbi:uncharacterized protein TNCT_666391 [Trichonephila clavata]|uniref:Uncharacterized protein n=1 Tax=Trichonephila clavata TaxID=2740835 RepID=A0A8X6GTI9_TRICU|nr:uncharacterized protein TNCT_666391 [Trichonephila clavata]
MSKCSKCRRYCRLVTTFLFSHIGLCGLVVGYSLVGAFTFEALEAGYEQTKRQIMLKERENVVTGLWSLTTMSNVLSERNWTALATETLQEFEVVLVRAVRKEGYDGKDDSPLQWTFSGALLYSIIVITTIEEKERITETYLDKAAKCSFQFKVNFRMIDYGKDSEIRLLF